MRNIFLILILLINNSILSFTQEAVDSIRFDRLLEKTEKELNVLDNKYGMIQEQLKTYQEGNEQIHNFLEKTDSLHSVSIEELQLENEHLRNRISGVQDSLGIRFASLQQEIYNLKKGNATLLLIIFSLLVIFFVYFFYRNYRIESSMSQQFMKVSLESEKKYIKLKDNFRKKLSRLSESLEKKFKKQIGKTEKSLTRQIRKKK